MWDFVTDFGDSAVTLPLALLTSGFLLTVGARRTAVAWLVAIGGCAATMAALKLVFGACGHATGPAGIVSPSGHAAMSTVVYGGLAVLVGRHQPLRRRWAAGAMAGLAVIGIGLSRWVLDDHRLAEVALGLAVGAAALGLFAVRLGREPLPPLPFGWLVLGAGLLLVLMHGTRWMVEPAVHRLAWAFRLALPWCR